MEGDGRRFVVWAKGKFTSDCGGSMLLLSTPNWTQSFSRAGNRPSFTQHSIPSAWRTINEQYSLFTDSETERGSRSTQDLLSPEWRSGPTGKWRQNPCV